MPFVGRVVGEIVADEPHVPNSHARREPHAGTYDSVEAEGHAPSRNIHEGTKGHSLAPLPLAAKRRYTGTARFILFRAPAF